MWLKDKLKTEFKEETSSLMVGIQKKMFAITGSKLC